MATNNVQFRPRLLYRVKLETETVCLCPTFWQIFIVRKRITLIKMRDDESITNHVIKRNVLGLRLRMNVH